ncbi:C-terminal binding protein [Candidatus Nitrospira neomarina]|uniref:C-terminal binding protein n=1 Tax=Candidatus Nitrospira neomarina TaxID=3020899 RepID=A0AA96GLM2_9BACT|nr:C-terminal binding protein [Candidatus Nitrospira neomarina]WNM63137.1 C-terminal binding protein [Candidatus Nitrospira neomarina]
MSKPVVIYTDAPWAWRSDKHLHSADIEHAVFEGKFDIRILPRGATQIADGKLKEFVEGAVAMVIYRTQITADLLDAAGPDLQVVGRAGVGYDNLAPSLLEDRGIIGFNVPDYCVDEVVTHTMALLLAAERGIVQQHVSLAGGEFNIYAGTIPRRLFEHTAGIVGFGRIGRAVAPRLRMFYGQVVAFDPYVSGDLMAGYGIRKVGLDKLLTGCDTILVHCTLTSETNRMFGQAEFEKMKLGAYFVNAARGALVQSKALHDALINGPLAGAVLDVFAPENPWDDEWLSKIVVLPNVVVTSHRAFLSREAEMSQRRRVAEGIRHVLLEGQPPVCGHITVNMPPNSTRAARSHSAGGYDVGR